MADKEINAQQEMNLDPASLPKGSRLLDVEGVPVALVPTAGSEAVLIVSDSPHLRMGRGWVRPDFSTAMRSALGRIRYCE